MFIHWKRGYGAPEPEPGVEAASSCYALIADGARWKNVEPWEVLSSTSADGIGASAVKSRTNASVTEWESHLTPSGDILGAGSLGSTPVDPDAPDEHNVVQFGNDPRAGVIAVTTVWGIFSGPVSMRRIVEWDMILDRDFTWSTSGEPGKMDLRNILTHELGHAMGMAHPSDSCTKETMYRFASEGERRRRGPCTGATSRASTPCTRRRRPASPKRHEARARSRSPGFVPVPGLRADRVHDQLALRPGHHRVVLLEELECLVPAAFPFGELGQPGGVRRRRFPGVGVGTLGEGEEDDRVPFSGQRMPVPPVANAPIFARLPSASRANATTALPVASFVEV